MIRHEVGVELGFEVDAGPSTTLVLQLAAARTAGEVLGESFVATGSAGLPINVDEIPSEHGGRLHVLTAGPGPLHVSYTAALAATPPPRLVTSSSPLTHEQILALRPSRYCPSDALAGFAASVLPDESSPAAIARSVASWVFEHVALVAGVSGPNDSAIDTLTAAGGVCRDFAHLTIALCRARGVAARFVAVYAPGLSPMDFHAVAEVHTEWGWEVFDATRQAPRSTLLRIATGADAAGAAFASTVRGHAELVSATVSAATDGWLPGDDHTSAVALA